MVNNEKKRILEAIVHLHINIHHYLVSWHSKPSHLLLNEDIYFFFIKHFINIDLSTFSLTKDGSIHILKCF